MKVKYKDLRTTFYSELVKGEFFRKMGETAVYKKTGRGMRKLGWKAS